MAVKHNRFLFLVACSPWQTRAQAATDFMLTAAVLDQPVSLCFTGAGVLHLHATQSGAAIGMKTLTDQYPALALYGIDQVYAETAALHQYGLTTDKLLMPVQAISTTGIAQLIRDSEVVHRCH